MIAPSRTAMASNLGLMARQWYGARGLTVTVDLTAAAGGRAAPRPAPRRLVADLRGLLTDGALVQPLAPSLAAAAAFTAGDGFLPGQIIDRSI